MKILVNTNDFELLNSLIRIAKEEDHDIVIARIERPLFEHIESEKIDAFILTGGSSYVAKAANMIKRFNVYTPIIVFDNTDTFKNIEADIYMPYVKGETPDFIAKTILHNVYMYIKNFEILQRLTAKMTGEIQFGDCSYDPTKRLLFHNGKKIHKLSPKQGGIFELLTSNFGQIVKKDVILEKVWHQSNYFVGRSQDVFVSHLRKVLRESSIDMTITNISNVGLILDYLHKEK